jgi:hypothetical protein
LPSFSPRLGENFDGAWLSLALFLPFSIYFRNEFLKTNYSETFSPSRLNRKTLRNILGEKLNITAGHLFDMIHLDFVNFVFAGFILLGIRSFYKCQVGERGAAR